MRGVHKSVKRLYTCLRLLLLILISLFLPRIFLLHSKRSAKANKSYAIDVGMYVVESDTKVLTETVQLANCCKCCTSKVL